MSDNLPNYEIDLQILEELESRIDEREIRAGIATMTVLFAAVVPQLSPRVRNATRFLAVLGLWVDTGFGGLDALRIAFGAVGKLSAETLPAQDLAYFLFARAIYFFMREDIDEAQKYFHMAEDGFAPHAFDELQAAPFYRNLIAYYLARCARNRGQYPTAMENTLAAEGWAMDRKKPKFAALIRSTRAWLLWQQGDPSATDMLHECERVLQETDDFTAKASIASMRGRLARRKGLYREAVATFQEAVRLAGDGNQEHPKAGRYRINLAASQRLLARELETELQRLADRSRDEFEVQRYVDSVVKRHKSVIEDSITEERADYAEAATAPGVVRFIALEARSEKLAQLHKEFLDRRDGLRKEVDALRHAAADGLRKARGIFEALADRKGLGLVDFYTGLLQLDQALLIEAAASGMAAHEHGIASKNPILQARARLLQCLAAKACGDAELDEPYPGYFYTNALEYGNDAVTIAREKASHKRIHARALLALGEVYATGFFDRSKEAFECCKSAEKLLETGDRDYLRRAYLELSCKLYGNAQEPPELMTFIQDLLKNALTGEQNRRQLVDRFEELIVVEVWKAEDFKIARVVKKLRMRESRIRSILTKRGFLRSS